MWLFQLLINSHSIRVPPTLHLLTFSNSDFNIFLMFLVEVEVAKNLTHGESVHLWNPQRAPQNHTPWHAWSLALAPQQTVLSTSMQAEELYIHQVDRRGMIATVFWRRRLL